MNKRLFSILICAAALLLFTVNVSADMGPKPSVVVTFEGLGDELCYGTLLSKNKSTGPASAWEGDPDTLDDPEVLDEAFNEEYGWYEDLDRDTWLAFVRYEDEDGYYFLQQGWRVDETKELAWRYYPPHDFKILLYFPESGTFAVSGACEHYAFDSYYTVNMEGVSIGGVEFDEEQSGNERYDAWLSAERSYNFKWELISLFLRIILTFAVEMLIALPFGYRERRQLALIAGVNGLTQIILNVLLNVINYSSGELLFAVMYIALELLVFALEAVIFGLLLHRLSKKEKPKAPWVAVVYALTANVVSFAVGFIISVIVPGIF